MILTFTYYIISQGEEVSKLLRLIMEGGGGGPGGGV